MRRRFTIALVFVLVAVTIAQNPIAAQSGMPSPTPSPSASGKNSPSPDPTWPLLRIAPGRGVVATTAVSADPQTGIRIANELAQDLRSFGVVKNSFLLPTTFSLENVIAECKADPSFEGAYVALPQLVVSGTESYIILSRSWTRVSFAIAVIACDSDITQEPRLAWVSNVTSGIRNRIVVTLLPLASLASIYSILAPSKTLQTTTTRAYPAKSPYPATGAVTTTATENQTVTNPSGANSIISALLQTYTNAQSANIGSLPSVDTQTGAAIEATGQIFAQTAQNLCRPILNAHPTPAPRSPANTPAPSPMPSIDPSDTFVTPADSGFCYW